MSLSFGFSIKELRQDLLSQVREMKIVKKVLRRAFLSVFACMIYYVSSLDGSITNLQGLVNSNIAGILFCVIFLGIFSFFNEILFESKRDMNIFMISGIIRRYF